MSPRPKNPPPDRRNDILEAALRVFADKGYTAATNADIAREAGITPAALYYYFPSKQDLFTAAVTDRRGILQAGLTEKLAEVSALPPETVLPILAQTISQFMTEPRTFALIRIILSEGPRNPDIAQIWATHVIGPLMPVILGYFMGQIDAGNLRPVDPRYLGLMMAGSVITLILVRDLLKLDLAQTIDTQEYARFLSDALLFGLTLPPKE
jgi:AcrR family transcriptional regulator